MEVHDLADALLTALGISSITLEPGDVSDPASLGQTGILGRSQFTSRNRAALIRALEGEPRPHNMSELSAAVERMATQDDDAAALLPSLKAAVESSPERALRDFALTD